MWFLRRPLTAFLASNLLEQFSRQIVVQILGMASSYNDGGETTAFLKMAICYLFWNVFFMLHKKYFYATTYINWAQGIDYQSQMD
jgi:hypothetical protein